MSAVFSEDERADVLRRYLQAYAYRHAGDLGMRAEMECPNFPVTHFAVGQTVTFLRHNSTNPIKPNTISGLIICLLTMEDDNGVQTMYAVIRVGDDPMSWKKYLIPLSDIQSVGEASQA